MGGNVEETGRDLYTDSVVCIFLNLESERQAHCHIELYTHTQQKQTDNYIIGLHLPITQ